MTRVQGSLSGKHGAMVPQANNRGMRHSTYGGASSSSGKHGAAAQSDEALELSRGCQLAAGQR